VNFDKATGAVEPGAEKVLEKVPAEKVPVFSGAR
jgi:hypothetical protein